MEGVTGLMVSATLGCCWLSASAPSLAPLLNSSLNSQLQLDNLSGLQQHRGLVLPSALGSGLISLQIRPAIPTSDQHLFPTDAPRALLDAAPLEAAGFRPP